MGSKQIRARAEELKKRIDLLEQQAKPWRKKLAVLQEKCPHTNKNGVLVSERCLDCDKFLTGYIR